MLAFPKPEGYDPHRYELLARLIAARTQAEGKVPSIKTVPEDRSHTERQGRRQQQRRILHRLHRRQLRLSRRRLPTRARDRQAHRDYQAGPLLFPGQRSESSRSAAQRIEPLGTRQGRVRRHRSLAQPAVHSRSAPHGRRIRRGAEGPADRPHQAGPHRHGLLQQRLAQPGAHRGRRRVRAQRRRYAGGGEAVPDPLPRHAAQARGSDAICWCRCVSRPATWPIRRCAWSRST